MARLPHVGPKPAPGDRRRREELDALYAELPALKCVGKCEDSCGPIITSRVEWQRMCKIVKEERRVDISETLVCPLLKDGLCEVYEVRPMLCRLWGLVETMKCPYGCVPERYLTQEEGHEMLRRSREIGA